MAEETEAAGLMYSLLPLLPSSRSEFVVMGIGIVNNCQDYFDGGSSSIIRDMDVPQRKRISLFRMLLSYQLENISRDITSVFLFAARDNPLPPSTCNGNCSVAVIWSMQGLRPRWFSNHYTAPDRKISDVITPYDARRLLSAEDFR
ncbi:predicted protein [Histoplasma capsulatum var. duboisii H88]|uniref:Predicted protein n=1 Tax=Ajellomyces capsulatus (strain H88) TaxID=544711 RepID=F0U9J3_AJEC8|nr:predicted protein [Histoplasma capsulatum var. duboisii H88]